jgi:hypothetical protein
MVTRRAVLSGAAIALGAPVVALADPGGVVPRPVRHVDRGHDGHRRRVPGRTVYLTFTGGRPADFVNLNWFTFER